MHLSRLTSLGLFVIVLIAAAPSRGQEQEQLGGKAELEGPFKKNYSHFVSLVMGAKAPSPADKEVIDVAARWYVHRFTWRAVAESPQELAKEFAKFQGEFDRELVGGVFNPNAKNNRAFVEQMGPALVRSIRPVFQADILPGDNRMIQVNAATLLPRMARLKQDEVSAYLAELVKDPTKHDAIRLYAAQGLREALPVRFFDDSDGGERKWEKQRDRELPYVDALIGMIEAGPNAKTGSVEPDVVRYLRREALESLAYVGVPAVKASKRDGAPQGAAAVTMLKVLSKKGLDPEPGIREKIEAAIGLCQMKYVIPTEAPPRAISEYRPELAVYLVGRFLEEFAKEHNAQWAFLKPGPNHKMPTVAWKIQSKRLELALKELVKNAAPSQLQPNIEEQRGVDRNAKRLEGMALPMLNDIYQGNQAQLLVPFRTEIMKMKPAAKTAFRTLKTPEIDLE
jgi:hypothetical protein